MRAVLIVRYSVISRAAAQSFLIGRQSYDSYRSQILNDDRLRQRHQLFSTLTLPSIAGQIPAPDASWFRMVVLTSSMLPANHRRNLESALAPFDWAVIDESDEDGRGGKPIENYIRQLCSDSRTDEVIPYLTLRLDDDDALSRNFLQRLSRYCAVPFTDHVISFGSGYVGLVDEPSMKIVGVSTVYYPKASMGLSHVGCLDRKSNQFLCRAAHIFKTGNHRIIDELYPTIIDCTQPAFLRTVHRGQDSHEGTKRQFDPRKAVDAHVVFKDIGLRSDVFAEGLANHT